MQHVWDALLVKLGLDVKGKLALARVERELVLDDGDHREVVGRDCDCLLFNLHNEEGPCEARSEGVGEGRGTAIADHVRHVWETVADPLQAILLREATSDDDPRQWQLLHLMLLQPRNSLVQVERLQRNLK